MNLRCAAHGLLPWLGHGICADCGKIYKRLLEIKEKCSCGSVLLPIGKAMIDRLFSAEKIEDRGGKVAFAGRPLCGKCAEGMAD
jgi:hypothetical protein